MRIEWKKTEEFPIPIDRYVICISSHLKTQADWVFVGKGMPKFNDSASTRFGVPISWVIWWHELPETPEKDGEDWLYSDEWIDCKRNPPPSFRNNSIEFLLFDEEKGIVEAEYWGGYQTDVVSCKFQYKKPVLWTPFPVLPLLSFGVLQV